MWWMLAREVLRMRGTISREHPWEVMPDLYFYRDPEEVKTCGRKCVSDVLLVYLPMVLYVCPEDRYLPVSWIWHLVSNLISCLSAGACCLVCVVRCVCSCATSAVFFVADWEGGAGCCWESSDKGGVPDWMDSPSSWIHCSSSAWGCWLVWGSAGPICANPAVPHRSVLWRGV